MTTITIMKEVYQFLASAIDPKHRAVPMRYVMVTDANSFVTTDGFRMHVYPTSGVENEPGFYALGEGKNRYTVTLYKVSEEETGKSDFYTVKNLIYPRIMGPGQNEPALMVYGVDDTELRPIDIEKYPKIKSKGMDMYFRRGIVDGEQRAVCLGINALPLEWGVDGLVNPVALDETIRLDAKFVLDALSSKLVHPTMRFADTRHPAIFGKTDGAHAIIMPVQCRR